MSSGITADWAGRAASSGKGCGRALTACPVGCPLSRLQWVHRGQSRDRPYCGLGEYGATERHDMNGAGMHANEAAEITARMAEVDKKLGQLEELARRICEKGVATSSSASR
ncbi:hypothetical protein [Streptomyces hesseae]|uniref:Uncharacterized protein n=1 Tax=Streptomyces hesseae TaxID=3075519 RepID=A0ABU2SSZ0_9ACTN|nr:hypothetical protein [Streptomyces sp. DSM 40473]MDT0451960.1 hypothetical protein [Streptomyces sp. DSM 40473]